MSKYHIQRNRWPQQHFEAGWWRACNERDHTELRFPFGSARLSRNTRPGKDYGFIQCILAGNLHTFTIRPCPTRKGLVRMACREIRKIVGEKAK